MATGNYVRRTLDMYADLGDLEALVTADGRRFTYAELRARILDTAAALFNSGLRQGNTIAMLVTNSAETLFIHFGAHLLGCRVVMLAHITPRVFLRGVLRYVEADAFFYEVERPGEIGRELALAAAPLPTYCIGPGGVGPDVTGPPAFFSFGPGLTAGGGSRSVGRNDGTSSFGFGNMPSRLGSLTMFCSGCGCFFSTTGSSSTFVSGALVVAARGGEVTDFGVPSPVPGGGKMMLTPSTNRCGACIPDTSTMPLNAMVCPSAEIQYGLRMA